jgi:hypothetical protein
VYSRKIGNQTYRFGVSGLLYKSNVLMYDLQTESLWSQVLQRSVTGRMTGAKLTRLPSTLTTWGKWRQEHPESDVLTPATGHVRDYSRDPYEDYYKSRSGLFGFLKGGPGAEDKELVVGIEIDGLARAYKLEELRNAGSFTDRFDEQIISLDYDDETDRLTALDQAGQTISHMILYWFVWKGIYPDSEVIEVKGER